MATKVPDHCFPKDSLDRFGDDLSQLVLKYLSLEDRFRFECVSKQWQRVVYQTQYQLLINKDLVNKLSKPKPNANEFYLNYKSETDKLKDIETIIGHKCPNIHEVSIGIDMRFLSIYIINLLQSLAKWRPNIKGLYIRNFNDSAYTASLCELIDQIVVFGQLQHLMVRWCQSYGTCHQIMTKLAANCPQLQSLRLKVVCGLSANMRDIMNGIPLLPNLSHLDLGFNRNYFEDSERLSVAPLLECRRLRSVRLVCDEDMDFTDIQSLKDSGVRVTQTKIPLYYEEYEPEDYGGGIRDIVEDDYYLDSD